jgi:8-oxo-dGTP pyrophosphatase MutT (NUDIX family)
VQDCIDSPEFMRPEHFILLNYVARASGTDVTLNDEAQEYRWVSPAEAFGLDLNEPTRLLLQEVLSQNLLP